MGPPPEFRAGQPPKAKGMIPPPKPPMLLDNVAFGKITLALLLIAINLVIKWFYKTRSYTEKMAELKNENLQSQLLYLKHQINPHFFMNTLNNIHALVDIEPEKAKSTIIELSKIMRHVLYDSPNEGVLLNKEIEFLRDYLNIMKIRYQDTVKVVEDFTEDNSGATVPPMLFITFLENAFKHGISYKQESIIETSIKVEDNKILFRCFNTKRNNNSERYGGIGLENATKRLNILYGEECTIEINEDETTYEFKLAIPSQMPSTKEIVSSSIF
ncbi:MAG: histidine kinase [Bacteroidales bacterium]|nr:histidine kinase [Bacteroidales bacterium]